jgi:hypothetical protein
MAIINHCESSLLETVQAVTVVSMIAYSFIIKCSWWQAFALPTDQSGNGGSGRDRNRKSFHPLL